MTIASERQRRILTTHTGSLPRPDALSELLLCKLLGESFSPADLSRHTDAAVNAIVARQIECGVDVINDGEQSKASFQIYATERLIRFASVVGRDQVMASSDCGFASTLARGVRPEIEPEIVWAKFASLAEGARLATAALWP